MSSRVDKIEVSAETAQLIRKQAEKLGVSVDEYLRALAESTATRTQAEPSEAEVEEILNELAGMGKDLPPLPQDFSREDIYSESN